MMSSPDNNAPARPEPGAVRAPSRPALPASPHGDTAKITHELASLLDGCLRNVGLVMSSLRGSARGHAGAAAAEFELVRRLETANQAMQQMAQLIHAWMSQAHRPTLSAQDSAWTLGRTIEQAVRLIQPAAEHHGIGVRIELDPALAGTPAGLIYPAIANALRNSIEAMTGNEAPGHDQPQQDEAGSTGPPGNAHAASSATRQIELSAHRRGDWIEISIADDGPGLDPAALDPTGQLRPGLTTKPAGHGLGLALSREIIEHLGGTLGVTNRMPRGAVTVLRIPAAANAGREEFKAQGPKSKVEGDERRSDPCSSSNQKSETSNQQSSSAP